MKRLFGTNGIRFVLGRDFMLEDVLKVGLAIGTFFGKRRCLLGRDVRLTGETIASSVASALMSTGVSVYDAGLITTPALQYSVKSGDFDFGIMITASHNPPEFNGIKVIDSDGVEIPREKEKVIESIFFEGKFRYVSWNEVGSYMRIQGLVEDYVRAVLKHVNISAIMERKLTVAVDPANSVGVLTTPLLLKSLNCRVLTVNAHLDGTFPGRDPEPRLDNLGTLSDAVIAAGADMGVAHDGDGDRAIFVDEKGRAHWGDRSAALIVMDYLERNPGGTIVAPVSTSKAVEDVVNKHGGKLVYTKVGSIIVSRTMLKLGAELGIEENGGIFYAPHIPVRDGTMATALILDILTRRNEPLSKLFASLPKYYQVKDKVPCPNELKEAVLRALLSEIKGGRVETIDGAKVWFSDGSWILARPSGTEPIYRVFAEAKEPGRAQALVEEMKAKLRDIISSLMSRA